VLLSDKHLLFKLLTPSRAETGTGDDHDLSMMEQTVETG
jgi:hypothetical protein